MPTALSSTDYRIVVEQSPIMIWRTDQHAKCDYFNQRWLLFTGRPMVDELGDGWLASVHPDDRDRCMHTFLDAFNLHQSFEMEYRLRRYDGEYRWIVDAGGPIFDVNGAFLGYVGSAVDCHDRVDARAMLARANIKSLGLDGA
jgi:PAS domain S-box-containing protein